MAHEPAATGHRQSQRPCRNVVCVALKSALCGAGSRRGPGRAPGSAAWRLYGVHALTDGTYTSVLLRPPCCWEPVPGRRNMHRALWLEGRGLNSRARDHAAACTCRSPSYSVLGPSSAPSPTRLPMRSSTGTKYEAGSWKRPGGKGKNGNLTAKRRRRSSLDGLTASRAEHRRTTRTFFSPRLQWV